VVRKSRLSGRAVVLSAHLAEPKTLVRGGRRVMVEGAASGCGHEGGRARRGCRGGRAAGAGAGEGRGREREGGRGGGADEKGGQEEERWDGTTHVGVSCATSVRSGD
jgi:hypothetical protein